MKEAIPRKVHIMRVTDLGGCSKALPQMDAAENRVSCKGWKNVSTEKRRFPFHWKVGRFQWKNKEPQKRNKPHLARLPQEPGQRFRNRGKKIYKTPSQESPPGQALPKELELVSPPPVTPRPCPAPPGAGLSSATAAMLPSPHARG